MSPLSLTPEGAVLAAQAIAERFAGAELVVGDGQVIARKPATIRLEGPVIVLSVEFSELEANFEWSDRRVEVDGVIVDAEMADRGRKALGAIWTLEVEISAEP